MPAAVTFAKYDIPYPIFEADFDPYNRGYLLVAGGGGENNTGVDNKLTLLDVSDRSSISQAAEIDLSKDEDSIQSLASLATKDGLVVYAGLNSGSADIKTGVNEHFRSFIIDFPARRRQQQKESEKKEQLPQGKISFAGKTAFFDPPDAKSKTQTYQRLLRLSPVKQSRESAGKRVGAIGTAWAKKNEIVLFDATDATPKKGHAFARIETHDGAEAEDIDIIELKEGQFSMAYCTDSTVLLYTWDYNFSKRKAKSLTQKPLVIFTGGVSKTGQKAKLRSLRWISPEHLLVMQNLPGGGAQLLTIRVRPAELSDEAIPDAYLTIRKQLPTSVKQAVNRGFDVCLLDADPASGKRQIVVAVAGSDRSIHLFTLNYTPRSKNTASFMSPFNDFNVLKEVHPNAIGKLTFTNFFPPKQPADKATSVATATQYIQLASISVANTVVVDTLPLTSTPIAPANTPDAGSQVKGPSVRYVLSSARSELLRSWIGLIFTGMIVVFLAIFIQSGLSYSNLQGHESALDSVIAAADSLASYFPPHVQQGASSFLANFRRLSSPTHAIPTANTPPTAQTTQQVETISSEVPQILNPVPDKDDIASILSDPDSFGVLHFHDPDPDSTSDPSTGSEAGGDSEADKLASKVHHPAATAAIEAAGATKYEDLHPETQKRWRDKLKRAGHWAEAQGESVLLGVLFSEYAGVVGGAVRDAVLG